MTVPSLESWRWQLAQEVAQQCCALGIPAADLLVSATIAEGLLTVTVADPLWDTSRKPMRLQVATFPCNERAGPALMQAAAIKSAITGEVARLSEPEPPEPHWFESLAGSLAVWTKRLGIGLESMQLRLDADSDDRVNIHVDDDDAANVVSVPLPCGVRAIDLSALARAVRSEAVSQDRAVRH